MLNVLLVTQDDPFYVPRFFEEFLALQPDEGVKIHGVVIQAPLGKKSFRALSQQMFDFYGPVDFLRLGCKFACFKVLNLLAVKLFRGQFPGVFSLEHLLLKRRWNTIHLRNVNSPEFLALLEKLQIDLLVSVAASQKFKPEVITKPRYGCINIHNSKLPKNRGMLPNFWSLYHCDTEPISAMTVHKMNEALDDGLIVLQEPIELNPKESLDDLIIRTKRRNAHLIARAISLFKNGEPPYLPNDAAQATYNTFPTKEDVAKFKAKGLRLL